ncbi:tyrosine-type recombinase/integrase [Spiribacter roseus]|uniref:tyrosine-type recombinase/integrase n=1 Tax=Spiribacter roseus TaxID=1855875 RepID=UPI00296F16D5
MYMGQARVLTDKELKQVLNYNDACERHAARNRLMLLLTHWAGMRVGEVVALRVCDVATEDGAARTEIRLRSTQTKGKHARTVFVSTRLQREIAKYLKTSNTRYSERFLFRTQKSQQFSANTATQLLQRIYARAGMRGATSHSGRRSYLTKLADKGVGVFVLAQLAGHRHISTTQRYVSVSDTQLRNAAELAS